MGVGTALHGSGTINGNVSNAAEIVVNDLIVNGDFNQGGNGKLKVSVAGTGQGNFDHLQVNGQVVLAGILEISVVLPGFPLAGGVVEFLSFTGQRNGQFTQLVLQGMATNYSWTAIYNNANVQLQGQPV